ncbi:MAG: hypothetical protein LBB88_09055 [Planctomycetaceae bacterium]|nr:hypothetical protein [Planctomycetaceae bacterium]
MSYKLTNVETQCLASLLFDQKITDRDKMDSTIIKINSDLPSATADATFRRKVAYLSRG